MFAFAVWDTVEKTLFCARDHIGLKPLFYTHIDGSFVYGSELKTIEHVLPQAKLCRQAITEYIIYNYIPAPKTIFQNIHKLEPGHYLEFKLNRFPECWKN